MTGEEALEHAKALKEYCSDRDNLDECCEGCPFHFYLGTRGICVMNYGLYPSEWFKPQEISDRNLKMWEDIYAEEKRRERSE